MALFYAAMKKNQFLSWDFSFMAKSMSFPMQSSQFVS